MEYLRYVQLQGLKKQNKLVKDNIYHTEQGIYIGLSDRSFRLYKSSLGPDITISETSPDDPKIGSIWIDIS